MSLEYKAIIKPNGEIRTEVIARSGTDCSEIEKVVQRLGKVTSSERKDDEDQQPVHETVNS